MTMEFVSFDDDPNLPRYPFSPSSSSSSSSSLALAFNKSSSLSSSSPSSHYHQAKPSSRFTITGASVSLNVALPWSEAREIRKVSLRGQRDLYG